MCTYCFYLKILLGDCSPKEKIFRCIMKRAVDLIELDVSENLYYTDISLASQNIYEIYDALENSIIRKC